MKRLLPLCLYVSVLISTAAAETQAEFRRRNPAARLRNMIYCALFKCTHLEMIMEATMLDFRHRMGDIEAALARRERVNVRSHGRRWAVLIAWEDAKIETPKARDFAAAGMWADREELSDPLEHVRKLRSRRAFA